MAADDRARWDARYTSGPRHLRAHDPNPLLIRFAPPAYSGIRALELACGLGRDALWLAGQGYTVDALDVSLVALRRARAAMLERGIEGVNFILADLDHYPLPPRRYDLVYVYRFLDRRLFPEIRSRVRPGGLAIYETLNVRRHLRYPAARPEHMLELGELPGHFPGWRILAASDAGTTSYIVARKPGEA